MSCSVFSDFAIIVQLVLGICIVLVLLLEFVVERFRDEQPRTFVQFWMDTFKLCCGALVSHGFNVLVATMLYSSAHKDADECALYTVAFYYELTGVTVIQMMQYGLIKYSRRKYLQLKEENNGKDTPWSKRWLWISYPGYYTDDMIASEQQHLLSTNTKHQGLYTDGLDNDKINNNNNNNTNTNINIITDNSNNDDDDKDSNNNNDNMHESELDENVYDTERIPLKQSQQQLSHHIANNDLSGDTNNELLQSRYNKGQGISASSSNISLVDTRLSDPTTRSIVIMITVLGTIGTILFAFYVMSYNAWMASVLGIYSMGMLATLGVTTSPCLWQTLSWVCIKIIERGIWTFFAYLLRNDFRDYAATMVLDDSHLETILYIAVIPLTLGMVIFLLYSHIARMHIPFVSVKEFASDVMAKFNLKEALKVGIISTLLYNGILYIVAIIVLLSWDAVLILFIMMVVVPILTCALIILCLWKLLKNMDNASTARNER